MDASAAATTLQRQGFVHVPAVFGPEEVQLLRRQMDALFDDPALQGREDPELHDSQYVQKGGMLLRNTISLAPSFLNLLTHPVLLALGEAALGPNCRFCGQNGLRSAPGMAIDTFHVDCPVIFPLPEGTPRHEYPPPLLWLTVQIALSDVDSVDHGPTQYVPCSHMSGRYPPRDTPHPSFEGQGPVSMLCKAGDVYVQNPNCWHRGVSGAAACLLRALGLTDSSAARHLQHIAICCAGTEHVRPDAILVPDPVCRRLGVPTVRMDEPSSGARVGAAAC